MDIKPNHGTSPVSSEIYPTFSTSDDNNVNVSRRIMPPGVASASSESKPLGKRSVTTTLDINHREMEHLILTNCFSNDVHYLMSEKPRTSSAGMDSEQSGRLAIDNA